MPEQDSLHKTDQQIVFMIAEISEISVNTVSVIFTCSE